MKDYFNNMDVEAGSAVIILYKGQFRTGIIKEVKSDSVVVSFRWNDKPKTVERMSAGIVMKSQSSTTLTKEDIIAEYAKVMRDVISPSSVPVHEFQVGDKVLTQYANSNNFMLGTITDISGTSFWKQYHISPVKGIVRRYNQLLKYPL